MNVKSTSTAVEGAKIKILLITKDLRQKKCQV